jgi:hypothetical protein
LVGLVAAAAVDVCWAQTRTATMTASIAVMARLSLSPTAISFPDSSPDTVPSVPASPGPVSIVAKARAPQNGAVLLTVLASDDLRSGVITIPASRITWTATGAGFVGGTLNRTTAQTVGSWIGSGSRNGTQNFFFTNLWTYSTGTYSTTMIYTLSVP